METTQWTGADLEVRIKHVLFEHLKVKKQNLWRSKSCKHKEKIFYALNGKCFAQQWSISSCIILQRTVSCTTWYFYKKSLGQTDSMFSKKQDCSSYDHTLLEMSRSLDRRCLLSKLLCRPTEKSLKSHKEYYYSKSDRNMLVTNTKRKVYIYLLVHLFPQFQLIFSS